MMLTVRTSGMTRPRCGGDNTGLGMAIAIIDIIIIRRIII